MKTIFRILIILVVTAIVGGLMYAGVSASGSATTTFEDGEGRPQLPEGAEFRPEHEEHEGREGRDGGFGFPGGVVKSLILMSVAGGIYSVIVQAGKKAKRAASA
ncbi:MAG: hypothetical protein J0M11_05725 [Anaerolineae bacterium]|nr:hypothetical protein [Anaerolineae bacterium]